MTGESATIRFLLLEPFEKALKLIRRSIMEDGLEIPIILNPSERIRKELGINFPPCRVFCVDAPLVLVEAMTFEDGAAVLLPLHVVVTGRGSKTQVQLLSPTHIINSTLPVSAKIPLNKLQTRVCHVLEKIAIRDGFAR